MVIVFWLVLARDGQHANREVSLSYVLVADDGQVVGAHVAHVIPEDQRRRRHTPAQPKPVSSSQQTPQARARRQSPEPVGEKARAAHRNFLAAYGKTRHEVPLVQYNAWDSRRPFREVE